MGDEVRKWPTDQTAASLKDCPTNGRRCKKMSDQSESGYLDELALSEGELLVTVLRVGWHGGRVVVEQGHKDPGRERAWPTPLSPNRVTKNFKWTKLIWFLGYCSYQKQWFTKLSLCIFKGTVVWKLGPDFYPCSVPCRGCSPGRPAAGPD